MVRTQCGHCGDLIPGQGMKISQATRLSQTKNKKQKQKVFFFPPPKQGNIFTSTRDQGVDIFGGKGAIIQPITVAQEFGTEQVKK